MEAIAEGYSEGIALERPASQRRQRPELFLVRDGVIYTPPLRPSILPGITRDSVITLARDLGFQVREEVLPREMLYIADEAFFVGTAVGDHADPVGRQDHGRLAAGADRSPKRCRRVLRHHQRRGARPPWLADLRLPGEPRQAATARRSEPRNDRFEAP